MLKEFRSYILGIFIYSLFFTLFVGIPLSVCSVLYKLFILSLTNVQVYSIFLEVCISVWICFLLFSFMLVLIYLLYKDIFDKVHNLKQENSKENNMFLCILPDIKFIVSNYIIEK